MQSSQEKTRQLRQFEALAKAAIDQAEQQKRFVGRISPEVVVEIYRIGHRILALIEDRELDTNAPDYSFGLYTALLKLHKSDRAKQDRLYGRADSQTISEIGRLEYMLDQLRADQHSPHKPETDQPEVLRVRERLQKLLT